MTFDGKAFGQEIVKEVKGFVAREIAPVLKRLEALETRLASLPTPKDGKDADLNEVRSIISDEVKSLSAALAAIEPAPKLPDIPQMVDDLVSARMGEVEKTVADLVAWPEPVSAKSAFIDREGRLVLTFSNGDTKELGVVVGRDGEDGKPGADGIGFDDIDFEYDGKKSGFIRFIRGDQVKEFTMTFPIVADCGVFKEGESYSAGDGVTWGGSFWIAQETTSEKPDSGKGWRLAVKKGRDGKDGVMKAAPSRDPIKVTIPKGGE